MTATSYSEAIKNEPTELDESSVNQAVWDLVDCYGWNISVWQEVSKSFKWIQYARIAKNTKYGRVDIKFRVSHTQEKAVKSIADRIKYQNCDIKTAEWKDENNFLDL